MNDNLEFAEKLAKAMAKFPSEFQEAGNGLSLLEKQLANLCIQVAEDMLFAKSAEKLSLMINFSRNNALVGSALVRCVQHLTGEIHYRLFAICRPWQIVKKSVALNSEQLVDKSTLNMRAKVLKKIGIKSFSSPRQFLRGMVEEEGSETTAS